MENVLENIPYQNEKMGSRKLVDEKYLLLMQAALKPGQSVPQHNANSNVHILVVRGVDADPDTVRIKGGEVPAGGTVPKGDG